MLRPALLATLALFPLSALNGCASTDSILATDADANSAHGSEATAPDDDEDEDEQEEDGDEASAAKKAAKLAREVAGLEFKLGQAQLSLAATEIQTGLDLEAAQQALEDAAIDQQEAIMALETFRALESKHELDSARLSLDRAQNRAVESAQELAELQSMYDVEEFAEKTKELVISRGERNLAFAQRSLELQQRSFAHLEGWELPKKLRDLERKAAEAERKVAVAQAKLDKAKIEAEKGLASARHAIEDLEQDIAEKSEELDA